MSSPAVVSEPAFDVRGHGWRSVIAGASVWCWSLVLVDWDGPGLLVALAALVACPLGLIVGAAPGRPSLPWVAAVVLQLPAALLLVPAFALSPGLGAGLLTLPWLAFAGLTALAGFERLRRGREGDGWGVAVGLVFLPVGAAWLLASRLGLSPLGFAEPIILLTAAHFHYAGFVLPVLTGLAAREQGGRLARATTLAVAVGVPLVAVGITARHLDPGLAVIDRLAAWWLSAACVGVAVLEARSALRLRGLARGLLLVSSTSLVAGMALAGLYAAGVAWLDIPTMIRTHAVINAAGFALPGLLGRAAASGGER